MWKATRRGKSSSYDLQPYNTTLTGTPAPGQDLSIQFLGGNILNLVPVSHLILPQLASFFICFCATRIRELGNSDDVPTYMLR